MLCGRPNPRNGRRTRVDSRNAATAARGLKRQITQPAAQVQNQTVNMGERQPLKRIELKRALFDLALKLLFEEFNRL